MIEVLERTPTVEEYEAIVASVGFRSHDPDAVEIALRNTVFPVCAMEGERVIGIGRIIGDGAISFLLTNVMVLQGRGMGTRIVRELCCLMETVPYRNVVLEAVPLPGLEGFYEGCGFSFSRAAPPGMVRWFHLE